MVISHHLLPFYPRHSYRVLAPITARTGDEFLFGITGISGLSNPLGSEGLAPTKMEDDEDSGEGAPVKRAGGTNGTHTEGGVVKANKGMILRKSVEYIKCASLHSRMVSSVG